MKKRGWFKHAEHGYMFRGKSVGGRQIVVTDYCLYGADTQDDRAQWEAWKAAGYRRMYNGFLAVDEMRVGDHNPDFRPVDARTVPAWIRADFKKAVG